MDELIKPADGSLIYEDDKLYLCLATYPITKGHTIVAWKNQVKDLHSLPRTEYEYLMDTVDLARNALMEKFGIEKVYLLYMDEVNHVHWHLIPRYNERGFNVLKHEPTMASDYSVVTDLRGIFQRMKNAK